MTLSLAHRRAILTWRSAEVVSLYLISLQNYACSNIFSKISSYKNYLFLKQIFEKSQYKTINPIVIYSL